MRMSIKDYIIKKYGVDESLAWVISHAIHETYDKQFLREKMYTCYTVLWYASSHTEKGGKYLLKLSFVYFDKWQTYVINGQHD